MLPDYLASSRIALLSRTLAAFGLPKLSFARCATGQRPSPVRNGAGFRDKSLFSAAGYDTGRICPMPPDSVGSVIQLTLSRGHPRESGASCVEATAIE